MTTAIAVLSQSAIGDVSMTPPSGLLDRVWQAKIEADNAYANGATLKSAEAVTERTKSEADRVYRRGVSEYNARRQWADAASAVKRVQARYDLLEGIQGNAQSH